MTDESTEPTEPLTATADNASTSIFATSEPVVDPTVTVVDSTPDQTDSTKAVDTTVTETPEVTPAASETPDPADSAPIETPDVSATPGILLPTDGNWSTEQIAAAEKLGVQTPVGAPLSPAARETLRGLELTLQVIENAIADIRSIVSKIPK